MLIQFTNTALLGLIIIQTLSGVFVLFWPISPLLMDAHRWAGWALLLLLPWKGIIVVRSLARGLNTSLDRGLMPLLSSGMAGLLLLLLAAGLAWTWRVGDWLVLLGQTVISWHWVFSLALLPLLAIHLWHRWFNLKRRYLLSRRSAVQALGLGSAGLLGWRLAESLAQQRQLEHHPRSAASGSRQYRSFSGNAMPVTTNAGEEPRLLDPQTWSLSIGGLVRQPLDFNYSQLMALPPQQLRATLDCTVGWYSTQQWRGVPLMSLVSRAEPLARANFVRLWSDTGYNKSFSLDQAESLLLATHIQEEPLSHEHGFPLRLIAPGWRGWFWVKWLTRIELESRPPA